MFYRACKQFSSTAFGNIQRLLHYTFLATIISFTLSASFSIWAGVAAPATLTLEVSEVINDNGGSATVSDFRMDYYNNGNWSEPAITGDPLVTGVEVASGVEIYLDVYAYDVGYGYDNWTCDVSSEDGPVDAEWGHITLAPNDVAICSVVVDDRQAFLSLVKIVENDGDGGDAGPSDWILSATDSLNNVVVTGDGDYNAYGQIDGGQYQLSESEGPAGYIAGDWYCEISEGKGQGLNNSKIDAVTRVAGSSTNGNSDYILDVVDGVVTIPVGVDVFCEIVNYDTPPQLTLTKVVIIDDGGLAEPGDFILQVVGPGGVPNISGASGSDEITDISLPAGAYNLYEADGPEGYIWDSWECDGGTLQGNVITLAFGDDVTCTVTNDDLPGHLQLIKELVLDNGGNAEVTNWNLSATGAKSSLNGVSGVEGDVNAGTYQLSETGGPAGYTALGWVCETVVDDGPVATRDSTTGAAVPSEGSVSIANGESVICTVTNDDNPPGLTLVKVVTDGEAAPADFALTLTGADGTHNSGADYNSGAMPVVAAGVQYQVSEADGQVEDYFLDSIVCTDNADQSVVAQPFTLTAGQGITCTVTNIFNEVIFDQIAEACVNDTPVVNYDVTTTSGVAPDVTITWIKNDGSNDVVETLLNQPTMGQLLWPGAEIVDGVPVAWPGWICDAQGSNCTEVDDGLVPSMQLKFEINPTATIVVDYPPATPGCLTGPPPPPAPPPTTLVPIPVDNALALFLLTLLMLATGWYMRPVVSRNR